MKKQIIILAVAALSVVLFSFANAIPETYSLRVEVKNLRNENGVVQFALYNKDGSIPDHDYEHYYRIERGKIVDASSAITFENIPPGKYAVNILHDENKNGKIDKGFILPVEGVGFSNYQSIGLTNRPNFTKASFDVKQNKTVSIMVIYL
jgi:uncharacterized protein (DUF2141 family)